MNNPIEECKAKKLELDSIRPLPSETEQRVLQKLRLDWNYHSNHLEGNTLSYGETRALILHGLTAQGKPLKDHFEITGHNEAIYWVEDLVRNETPLTEAVIRQLHTLILKEDHYIDAQTDDGLPTRLLVEIGRYKTLPNHVKTITGETVFFTSPMDTPQAMQELLDWYREQHAEPIILASMFHYRLIRIHPFADGNGRVARLVMNFILMMHGYPPVIVKTEDKSVYLSALRSADAGELEVFVDYVATNLSSSLDLMLRAASGESIEEPEDIEKELALLRQRFEASGEIIRAVKSPQTIDEAWHLWIKDWLIKFQEKLNATFEPFYLKISTSWISGNNLTISEAMPELLARIERNLGSSTSTITLDLDFEILRKKNHENFKFKSRLRIKFHETYISISPVGLGLQETVLYGDNPAESQFKKLINACIKNHSKALDGWLRLQEARARGGYFKISAATDSSFVFAFHDGKDSQIFTSAVYSTKASAEAGIVATKAALANSSRVMIEGTGPYYFRIEGENGETLIVSLPFNSMDALKAAIDKVLERAVAADTFYEIS